MQLALSVLRQQLTSAPENLVEAYKWASVAESRSVFEGMVPCRSGTGHVSLTATPNITRTESPPPSATICRIAGHVRENFGRPLAEATVMASGAQGARAAKHLPPHPPVRFFRTCIPVIACGTVAARSRNQRLFWS